MYRVKILIKKLTDFYLDKVEGMSLLLLQLVSLANAGFQESAELQIKSKIHQLSFFSTKYIANSLQIKPKRHGSHENKKKT